MPEFKKYPNESPAAARQRIAKNIAKANTPVANPEMGYNNSLTWNDKREGTPVPRVRKPKPGYNPTRNIGSTPDVGY